MHVYTSRVSRFFGRVPSGIAYVAKALAARLDKGPPDDINTYERRFYSQNGEDGIIEELFARLAPARPFFVEFGVQDGLECNAANLAFRHAWPGLMIEGDPMTARHLRSNYKRLEVATVEAFVSRENIAAIFADNGVPRDLAFLSIDIDGNDYWVWEALSEYRAALVVIEFNAFYPPPFEWIMTYDAHHLWNGSTYHGASLSSLTKLADRLGYVLLGTDRCGVNAFYLRRDLVGDSGFRPKTPQEAYHLQRGFPRLRYGYGPFVQSQA